MNDRAEDIHIKMFSLNLSAHTILSLLTNESAHINFKTLIDELALIDKSKDINLSYKHLRKASKIKLNLKRYFKSFIHNE